MISTKSKKEWYDVICVIVAKFGFADRRGNYYDHFI